MPIIDMTLSNPTIRGYFEGSNDKAPVAEFMYIHTHPMTQNFLSEIEILINTTSMILKDRPNSQGVVTRLAGYASRYGELLGEMTEDKAKQLLAILRDVYQLCARIHKYKPAG